MAQIIRFRYQSFFAKLFLAKNSLRIFAGLALAAWVGLSGCGYAIRNGKNGALEKEGVRKIYIAPVINDTFRYGIENVVYNSLVKSLRAYSGIRLVSEPTDADAVLTSRVIQAESRVNSTTFAKDLSPKGLPTPDYFGSILIATDYNAILTCSFELIRREPDPRDPNRHPAGKVWTGSFVRSKLYPGSNQLGVLGTTSGLINDSEFDRTIVDVSHDMMVDVREAMLSRF
jgi:hypothetical protein